MDVLRRKEFEARREWRERKRRIEFINEEMHRLADENWNIRELLESLRCEYTQYAADKCKELNRRKRIADLKYHHLIEESDKLENMPEPEIEILFSDLTKEEMERVQFTSYGWAIRLDDGRILQVIPKQKTFYVVNPRNRCAKPQRC